jgi:hypothetical protein
MRCSGKVHAVETPRGLTVAADYLTKTKKAKSRKWDQTPFGTSKVDSVLCAAAVTLFSLEKAKGRPIDLTTRRRVQDALRTVMDISSVLLCPASRQQGQMLKIVRHFLQQRITDLLG